MALRSLSDRRGFLTHVLPALLYGVALFWLGASHTSIDLELPQGFFGPDKLDHFGAFGLLVWLALRAFRFELPSSADNHLILMAFALSSLVGALLEIWQLLFPYRSSEFADWAADILGAFVAGCIAMLWLRWRGRRPLAPK